MQYSSQATLLRRYFHKLNIIGHHRLRASAALFAAMLLVVPFGASAALVKWNIAGATQAETVCTTIYPDGFPPQQVCTTFPSSNIQGMFIANTSLSSALAYSVIDYNITTDTGAVPFHLLFPYGVTFYGANYSSASSRIVDASHGSSTNPESSFTIQTNGGSLFTLYFVNPDPSATSIKFSAVEPGYRVSRYFTGQLSLVPIPVPPAFILFTTGILGIVGLFRRSRSAETERALT